MPKRHPNSIARFAEEILVTDHSTDTFRFADSVFGEAQLGDQRRTRRLVTLTDQICRHPGGSLPQKLHAPKDLKALYRLCDTKDVTHQAIIQSARQATLRKIQEHPDDVLILHDATELDYTRQTALGPQLGQIGKGNRKGYICHNSLVPRPILILGLPGASFFWNLHSHKEVPMNKKYIVRLTDEERAVCEATVKKEKGKSEKLRRAVILLKADIDGPGWRDEKISEAVGCRVRTVENVRRQFVLEGFEAALVRKKRTTPPTAKLLDGASEAKLIALRLGKPPAGYGHWTLRLLADQLVELEVVESISPETVRTTLKKTV